MKLFEIKKIEKKNDWKDEWLEMPEYDNIKQPEPFITATFKFRNKNDYDKFHKLIKEKIYKTRKVFDGMQSKEKKNAWYPHKEKASKYKYV